MVDPLTATVAAFAALAGTGGAWGMHRRVRKVEAQAAALRQQLAAQRHVASHDPLTGLPNRRAFFRLGEALLAEKVAGRPAQPLVAVVLDLDDFKQINDQLGHAAGDQVLAAFARRLADLAGGNLVARLGGDEFAGLLAVPTTDPALLRRTAMRLTETLAAPIPVAGQVVRLRVSVGVTPVPAATPLTDVLRHADAAMYRAKHQSRATRPDWSTTTMPTPSVHPHHRDPAAVAPADSYQHADPVWVYRADSWRAGVVEAASPQAVTVTYRPSDSRGTGVDTLTAAYLVPREDTDPLLDQTAAGEHRG